MSAVDLPVPQAAACLAEGGLVAFPTETTWGLGADARSEGALEALLRFKGRAAGKPVAVLVPDVGALASYGADLGEAAGSLLEEFWPGPLTLVTTCGASFARGIAAPDGRVGFRCSSHPVARELVAEALARGAAPLTATSLNRSGEPDCATRTAARLLAGHAVRLVAGPDAGGGPPSTVVAVGHDGVKILREGAIPASAIATVLTGDPAR